MESLTKPQIESLLKLLNTHESKLANDLSADLKRSKEENPISLLPEVPDKADLSVANLIADIDDIFVNKHAQEIEDIDAAKQRITNGKYGICIDCHSLINYERLLACPTAKRCIKCQSNYEKKHANAMPSL